MDMMPRYTAQSPEFRTSAQEANHRTIAQHQQGAGARAPPPTLLAEDDPEVQKQAFPFGDNLIAQFVIIRSGLSDQQRERLISAMSLKNITLDKITKWRRSTTTSSSRRSIHPTSRRQREEYEGEEGVWVGDEEGNEGFMASNDEETFCVLEERMTLSLREKCLGGI